MKKESNSKLRIIPIGGLEQIGMNITAFEYEDTIVVVDCGLAFPEDDMLGIDLVIPDVTYLKDNIDEFVFQLMLAYDGKNFVNVAAENVDLTSDEEKENLKKLNEDNKDMFAIMKEVIPDIEVVRFTNRLKNHAVCLTSEGQLSIEMAKTMNAMNDEQIKPQMVLEINENNKIAEKIKKLYVEDKEELKNYTKILYAQARLIEGLSVENPTEISNLICDILSK